MSKLPLIALLIVPYYAHAADHAYVVKKSAEPVALSASCKSKLGAAISAAIPSASLPSAQKYYCSQQWVAGEVAQRGCVAEFTKKGSKLDMVEAAKAMGLAPRLSDAGGGEFNLPYLQGAQLSSGAGQLHVDFLNSCGGVGLDVLVDFGCSRAGDDVVCFVNHLKVGDEDQAIADEAAGLFIRWAKAAELGE